MQDLLPHFFLRRTKDLIAHQMPKKYDHIVFCPLTVKQINVYKAFLAEEELYNILHKDDDCGCGSRMRSSPSPGTGPLSDNSIIFRRKECCYQEQSSPGIVLKYMDIFLKISNHLMLLCPGTRNPQGLGSTVTDLHQAPATTRNSSPGIQSSPKSLSRTVRLHSISH